MILVSGEKALGVFRRSWTGERLLALLAECGGRMRVDWAVGVGKSTAIDRIVEAAVLTGSYDLVLGFFPTRRVLEERPWIKSPPSHVAIVNLRPRPRKRCGPERDLAWQDYERRELGAIGRVEICGSCPHRNRCFWPEQYGKHLQRVGVIYATQAHLERSPSFILQLASRTQASNILVLLDEASFIMKSYRRTLSRDDLSRFVDVLRHLDPRGRGEWLYKAALLLKAPTSDLQAPEWRFPRFSPKWALAVQELGLRLHGSRFRFLGYNLVQFGHSPPDSRERMPNGDLLFAAPPFVNCDFAIFSGTAHADFAKFRLGKEFRSPFSDHRYEHPGTTWVNIASRLGTKSFFSKNSPQVLDFFAALIARRLKEGRRPLLIAKKCFVSLCATGIEHRLKELGLGDAKVVTRDWKPLALAKPCVVPLISYGTIGTNLFESFDCAYCLTGFYITEHILNTVLQDVLADRDHIPIEITTGGRPRRRTAGVKDPKHRFVDVHQLAQFALDQQEMDVVLQAVGRVRPYTRPREIITFQCAAHPQLAYTQEFNSIGEARTFFEIPPRRGQEGLKNRSQIEALKAGGFSQSRVAAETGLSLSTIKRYWRSALVSRSLYIY